MITESLLTRLDNSVSNMASNPRPVSNLDVLEVRHFIEVRQNACLTLDPPLIPL